MADEQLHLFEPGPPQLVVLDGDRDDSRPSPGLKPGDRIGNVVLLDPVERGWQIGGDDDAA